MPLTGRLTRMAMVALVGAASMLGGACGDDDGADVRELGDSGGSGSASASGSASGSGSASASGSGSASHGASGSGEGHGAGAVTADCDTADPPSGASEVQATLDDFTIFADPGQAPEGPIAFVAANTGVEAHELMIVEGENPDALPTTAEGAFDHEAAGDAFVGEIDAFAPGETCVGTADLAAGRYVLLCTVEDHFQQGMATSFTVTG